MTAPVALGRQIIAPLIPAFLKRYPDVQIQLDLSDRLAALATGASIWRSGTWPRCPTRMWRR